VIVRDLSTRKSKSVTGNSYEETGLNALVHVFWYVHGIYWTAVHVGGTGSVGRDGKTAGGGGSQLLNINLYSPHG